MLTHLAIKGYCPSSYHAAMRLLLIHNPRKSSVFDDNSISSSDPSIPVLDHTSLQHPQSSLVLDIVASAPIQISRIAGSAAFLLQFSSQFREM